MVLTIGFSRTQRSYMALNLYKMAKIIESLAIYGILKV